MFFFVVQEHSLSEEASAIFFFLSNSFTIVVVTDLLILSIAYFDSEGREYIISLSVWHYIAYWSFSLKFVLALEIL